MAYNDLYECPEGYRVIPYFTRYAYSFANNDIFNRVRGTYINALVKRYKTKNKGYKEIYYTQLHDDVTGKRKYIKFDEIRELIKRFYKL